MSKTSFEKNPLSAKRRSFFCNNKDPPSATTRILLVLRQEDRCVATRGFFVETCFAHNSAHRILPEFVYPDQSISFSIRTRSRQQNTLKPIQKPPKTTDKWGGLVNSGFAVGSLWGSLVFSCSVRRRLAHCCPLLNRQTRHRAFCLDRVLLC